MDQRQADHPDEETREGAPGERTHNPVSQVDERKRDRDERNGIEYLQRFRVPFEPETHERLPSERPELCGDDQRGERVEVVRKLRTDEARNSARIGCVPE